ncbi:hypothetical protein I4U23_028249 [Adineta vaga]|nr:hypothetical protein I4U23_028249 [Adineta vaga]
MPIRDYVGLVLSICSAGAMFWGCSFEIDQIIMGELVTAAGGKYKFLTILNMYLQMFYYILCIINFFFGSNTIITRFFFAGAVFPIGTFVCISFWGLYHFDRKLIYPEALDNLVSPILNHVMHTLPGIAIWLENLFHYHHYPSRLSGMICLLVATGGYTAWIHYLHHIHWLEFKMSLWVYPILNELSFMYRGLFFLGSTLFSIGLYLIGEMYTLFLTGLQIDNDERKKKKT